MKAEITWLGEDELHGEETSGPKSAEWRGIRFEKAKPVKVESRYFIEKAKANPFFKVDVTEDAKEGESSAPPAAEQSSTKSTSSVSPNQTAPKEAPKPGLKRPS